MGFECSAAHHTRPERVRGFPIERSDDRRRRRRAAREMRTQKKSDGELGCVAKSDDLPSEMKGVHPVEKSNKTGSEAPCVKPRGFQQRRSRNAVGGEPTVAKLRAVARSEPRRSLVRHNGEAEPFQGWRRQQAPLSRSTCMTVSSPGVAGTARSERKALNARDLDRRGWLRNGLSKAASQGSSTGREVGEAHSTVESGESRWREGGSLGKANKAMKERRLWQH